MTTRRGWLRERFWQRTVSASIDVAVLCALIETTILLWRVVGARTFATTLGVFGITALLVLPLALVVSAIVMLLPALPRPVRWVLSLLAIGGAAAAITIDATWYVRLYGAQHGLLGLAAVAALSFARCIAWPDANAVSPRRGVAALGTAALASMLFFARHNPAAWAAHRGVLAADALWALRADATSLPTMPQLPRAQPTQDTPLNARPALVLLVTIDALRFDTAQQQVYRALGTIRRNAVTFSQAHTTAPWTVPALYSMFTGVGPWRTRWTPTMFFGERPIPYRGRDRNPRRVWPLPMRDTHRTLAEAMHDAGYETRVCTTLPFQVPDGGLVRGFDTVDQGVYLRRNRDLRGVTSDLLTACGLAMIDAAQGRPLFLWLHYSDPHEPYATHADFPLPSLSERARYDGEVAFVDLHLGGLLANVERRVGMRNTLLVLSADHGEEFGEHGGAYHAVTLYEEVAHVPLMFVSNELRPHVVDTPVSLLDVAPTVLSLVGAPPLADAEGRSLVTALRGQSLTPRPVFAESIRYGRAIRMVLDGTHKLIYEGRARTYELFDLSRDPDERNLLTDQDPSRVNALARMLGVPSI